MKLFSKDKTLSELIRDQKDEREIRVAKINNRLFDRQAEAGRLKTAINTASSALVEAEINDDVAGQEKARASIIKHTNKLQEVQALIKAFKADLDNPVSTAKDLEKIRVVASRERANRLEKVKDALQRQADLERQIQDLQNEAKRVDQELSRLRMDAELNTLRPLLPTIDSRAASLPLHNDRDRWLSHWISGDFEAAEAILERHEQAMQARLEQQNPRQGKTIVIAPMPGLPEVEQPVGECVERRYTNFAEAK